MCDVNHQQDPRAGYLVHVGPETVAAPGALFTRTLAHHAEVGLTGEQVTGLLDVSRDYHDRMLGIIVEMARLGEQVEQKRGRIAQDTMDWRRPLLERRAELFLELELAFFDSGSRGQELLTDEQIATANGIYHTEKDMTLAALADSLANAVGPTFDFVKA